MRRIMPILLLLAACDRAPAPTGPVTATTSLSCALAGAAEFEATCRVSRASRGDAAVLTFYAPDGGFRRVEVSPDRQDISAADGAEAVSLANGPAGEIEIRIAKDRYRLASSGP